MVTKTMYQEIQKCKKKGYLKSEIARKMQLDPETVAKYYKMKESILGVRVRTYVSGQSV